MIQIGSTFRPSLRAIAAGLWLAAVPFAVARGDTAEQIADRAEMLRAIDRHARTTPDVLGRDHIDPEVVRVMGELPRHEFVPEDQADYAYDDRPLQIGHGQTISQPFIVALMTDLLAVEPDGVVLEVGTGSGYQAAVLARLVDQVHTIEIIPGLAESARERLN